MGCDALHLSLPNGWSEVEIKGSETDHAALLLFFPPSSSVLYI